MASTEGSPLVHQVAMMGQGRPRLTQVYIRANRVQVSMIEAAMRREHQTALGGARVMLARRDGTVLQPAAFINTDEEQILWAMTSEPLGATAVTPDVATILKEVLQPMQGRLKGNQIKLLLKGEQGLASRVYKARFDAQKQCALLLDAATRYGMQIQVQRAETGQQRQQGESEQWTKVGRKNGKAQQVLSQESPGGGAKSRRSLTVVRTSAAPEEKKYRLIPDQ